VSVLVRVSSRPRWYQHSTLSLWSVELAKHLELLGSMERTRLNGSREFHVTATHDAGDGFVRLVLPRTGLAYWDSWLDASASPPDDDGGIRYGSTVNPAILTAFPRLRTGLRDRPATD